MVNQPLNLDPPYIHLILFSLSLHHVSAKVSV